MRVTLALLVLAVVPAALCVPSKRSLSVNMKSGELKVSAVYGQVDSYGVIDGTLQGEVTLSSDLPDDALASIVVYREEAGGVLREQPRKPAVSLCKALVDKKSRLDYGFELVGLSAVNPGLLSCPVSKNDFVLAPYTPAVSSLPTNGAGSYSVRMVWTDSAGSEIGSWSISYEVA